MTPSPIMKFNMPYTTSKSQRLQIPKNYTPKLGLLETEIAIKRIKDYFERRLAESLNLMRVSAPLFVRPESGLNDNLNGVERPVGFDVKDMEADVEVIHSLAKWKRLMLQRYGFKMYEGLYTDMNAIRRDEELDNLHSIYVDQWDWEKIIDRSDRTEEKLKDIVRTIYKVFRETEQYLAAIYPALGQSLPEEIFFITSQELEDRFPGQTPKMREYLITKEKKAVFLMKIGKALKSGAPHDGRAPDYDDWELNGDILFYYPILDCALELSSMGIRVDEKALEAQLHIAGAEERRTLPFHKMLLKSELPLTVGGGIGQSRICMYFLQKAHIGEVQASVWPDDMIHECFENKIYIL